MLVRMLDWMATHGRLLGRLMLVGMALLVLAELFITKKPPRFFWEGWVGFGALWGLLSCLILAGFAKGLGVLLLYQPEDYYDD